MAKARPRHSPRLPAALVAIHCAIWVGIIAAVPQLPRTYFTERSPRVVRTPDGGMQFHINSSDPDFILAERPLGGHHPESESWPIALAGLLNVPAVISAIISQGFLEAPMGVLGASWARTAVFFAVGGLQWWGVGWLIRAIMERRSSSGSPRNRP